MSEEKIRPIFVVCPICDGVGFVLFESIVFAGIEEPSGLIRAKCEKCGGAGEVIESPQNPELNEALLELGAIQSMIAETLNLPTTPTTCEEIRQALETIK